jgi:hypothetical protein
VQQPSEAGQNASVLVVDENSMTSNRALHTVLDQVRANDQRLLLVGDSRQFTAIEAGQPHALLQQAGVTTLQLDQIQRQQNPTLLSAVHHAYDRQWPAVFHELDHCVVERPDADARLKALAQTYASLTPEEQAQTLVITLGNRERHQLNQYLQQALTEPLAKTGHTTTILTPRHFTRAEAQDARVYQPGDQVRFGAGVPSLGLQAGTYAEVRQNRPEVSGVELRRPDGERVLWRPRDHGSQVETYRPQSCTVQPGDLIQWTRTQRDQGLHSTELAQIQSAHDQKLTVQTITPTAQGLQPQGKPWTLQTDRPQDQHWDLAYAVTSYSAQGSTVKRVLMTADSQNANLLNQRAFLIGLTRAVDAFALYTDDKAALKSQLQMKTGDEPSALATAGQAPSPQNAEPQAQGATSRPQQANRDQAKYRALDAATVMHALHARTETVAQTLLGPPKERTPSHWVYSWSEVMGGDNQTRSGGSLYLAIDGPNRGCWFSFKAGEGGHLLQLIQQKERLNFKDALHKAQTLMGQPDVLMDAQLKEQAQLPGGQGESRNGFTDRQLRSIAYARKLVEGSQPVQGTLAETYLRDHRGIALNPWPASIRYHPGVYSKVNDAVRPALLAVARNQPNEVQAVQAVFLDNESGNKAQDLKVAKQTWGVPQGASVKLSHAHARHAYLAEGPETGLSVQQAQPEGEVHVTLGKNQFAHFEPGKHHQSVTLCLDHDRNNPQSDQATTKATEALSSKVNELWQARPEQAGTDYNDLLKTAGPQAVQASLNQASPGNEAAQVRQTQLRGYQAQRASICQPSQAGQQPTHPTQYQEPSSQPTKGDREPND